jgi:hypothetical protein
MSPCGFENPGIKPFPITVPWLLNQIVDDTGQAYNRAIRTPDDHLAVLADACDLASIVQELGHEASIEPGCAVRWGFLCVRAAGQQRQQGA